MSKSVNEAWFEKYLNARPPQRYDLMLDELFALKSYFKDEVQMMSFLYNYGFSRGRNYQRALARKKTDKKIP